MRDPQPLPYETSVQFRRRQRFIGNTLSTHDLKLQYEHRVTHGRSAALLPPDRMESWSGSRFKPQGASKNIGLPTAVPPNTTYTNDPLATAEYRPASSANFVLQCYFRSQQPYSRPSRFYAPAEYPDDARSRYLEAVGKAPNHNDVLDYETRAQFHERMSKLVDLL